MATRRKYNNYWKSLLHFDYPYFAEPNDGCRDEIGLLTWTRNGSILFGGSEIPYDVSCAPMFGYRCLYSTANTMFLSGTCDNMSFLNSLASGRYEFSFYVKPLGFGYAGNLLQVIANGSSIMTVQVSTSKNITVSGGVMNATLTSTSTLSQNSWQHVLIRFNSGTVSIYIGGTLAGTGSTKSGYSYSASAIYLGGFNGAMDEFLLRNSASNAAPAVPTQPYQGLYLWSDSLGGDGSTGALSLTSGTSYINTTGQVSAVSSTTAFTVSSWTNGTHGAITAGSEIMIIQFSKSGSAQEDKTGHYEFFTVKSINGTSVELSAAPTEFDMTTDNLKYYDMWVYSVPNYSSVSIGASAQVSPRKGIVVFRCKGDCTINGKILTSGINSFFRYDKQQMTHSQCPERFIIHSGGGVMIYCGGTITASSTARIGASWNGSAGAGTVTSRAAGGNAGAGYGGGGGSSNYDSHSLHTDPIYYYGYSTGGVGGVGGGGSLQYQTNITSGYNAGENTSTTVRTGGGGISYGLKYQAAAVGGAQGLTAGATPGYVKFAYGGAGALGHIYKVIKTTYDSGSVYTDTTLIRSGACVMLICKTLKVDAAAISTGGQGGQIINSANNLYNAENNVIVTGGGGTGMCYIACKSMA